MDSSPSKMSSGDGSSFSTKNMTIKEERIEEEFASPIRPPLSRGGLSRRVPCSIQKVPSISDLSDPESSSSLGMSTNLFFVCLHQQLLLALAKKTSAPL